MFDLPYIMAVSQKPDLVLSDTEKIVGVFFPVFCLFLKMRSDCYVVL